jgi:dipeptidyl aminopeptidase/acylaminoacyl peptidase
VLQNAADQAKSDLEKDLKNAEEKANANVNRGSLADARKGFQTKLTRRDVSKAAILEPPADVFRKIVYDAPSGKLGAYISPDPKDGKKHPAIVWITGGDCNTIGDVWTAADPGNDQTAAAYRKAGIIMMFPSLRGGDGNPGVKEGFLGEVDDVLAAANMLATESYVDPSRVYLGGHSTGGTMVLLVAEMGTDKFRSIFSFGPADVISGYGPERCPFDLTNTKEVELRSPLHWLASIKAPTFVFEGNEQGNIPSLQAMDMASKNPKARFFPVAGVSHFSILAPTNSLIAQKILNDTGPTCNISFTPDELRQAAGK